MNSTRTAHILLAIVFLFVTLPVYGVWDGGLEDGGGGGGETSPAVYLYPSVVSVPAGSTVRLDWWSDFVTSCTGTNFSTGGATGGSVDVIVNTTTNYFISCTGYMGPASASATVSVTASGADLVALDPISVFGSLTPGQSLTFSGVLKNVGNSTAPGGFQFRYQLDLGGDGSYDINFDGTVPNDVTASQTRAVTSSAWEALPGLHGVRLCVDIPPYPNGVVSEHTESNNCGTPLFFTVSSESNIDATQYSARCTGPVLQSTSHIEYDICVAMCSNVSAECCTVQHNYFHNGNEREPLWIENYDCTAHSGLDIEYAEPVVEYGVHPVWGGDSPSYWQTTWTALFPATAGPLEGALVANPTFIDRGESSLLSWSSSSATTCTGVGFDTGGATSGSVEVSPLVSTTYTLSCTNGVETVEDTAMVTVENILSVSCQASPNPADLFESVLWNSSVSGGTSGYTYTWSGTDGLSGSQSTAQKSYTSVGTKTATLTVVSGGEQVQTECTGEVCQEAQCTCTGPTCGVTVDEGTDTDLSAETPTLASGINEVGNAVTFSGTITNVGNNTVLGTFGNRFQVDIDADGSYDFTLDVPDSAYTIAPSGTYTVESPEWADLPLGVHAVRFCADLPPYPNGQIAESAEGNNCSADLPFAVGDSLLVLSISAQDIVQKNGQVTVTWNAANADSCTVTGPGLSAVSTSGSQLVTIASESTYTITCTRGALTSSESTTVRIAPRFEEV